MRIGTVSRLVAIAVLAVASTPQALRADDVNKQSVTASFGAGLNTAGAANHHVVPNVIKVRAGGVVNFVVGGFHQIFVYNPGVQPEDLIVPPLPPAVGGSAFINDFRNLYYHGLNPSNAAAPTGANPLSPPVNTTVRTNTGNRTESVSFANPGLYLVICNVNQHFRDGMIAWVRVLEDGEDDDHDDHGGHDGH